MKKKSCLLQRLQKENNFFSFFPYHIFFFGIVFFGLIIWPQTVLAADPTIHISGDYDSKVLTDHSYYTNLELPEGTILRIEQARNVHSLYLEWDLGTNQKQTIQKNATWFTSKPMVSPWVLRINGTSYVYGTKGFLHEYVKLPQQSDLLEIIIPKGGASLAELSALTEDELPDYVQIWDSPHEKADLLVLSAHSDDEILFFGGTIPYYAGERKLKTQVVYFTYHTEKCRTHELLNALYFCGIRNYPILGIHEDIYSSSLEHAKRLYDQTKALSFVVEQLRRFQPNVVITHDLGGEYGHGVHCLVADLLTKALIKANDPTVFPESAKKYGFWKVKKAYLHLYPENPIDMEWDDDLVSFGGQNLWDVTYQALQKYDSQLKYYGESLTRNPNKVYDCTRFGLYHTSVLNDTGINDFFEHIPLCSYRNKALPSIVKKSALPRVLKTTIAFPQARKNLDK